MFVQKRNGGREPVFFDKITKRNRILAYGEDLGLDQLNVDLIKLSIKVIEGLYPDIKTYEIDNLSAQSAASMAIYNPDYDRLASRICVSNLHKTSCVKFSEFADFLGERLNTEYLEFVRANRDELDAMIDCSRDYDISYFGYKTLEKSYLAKDSDGMVVERPQYMWMRVASFLRMPDLEKTREVYEMLSTKKFTHATPTLFHAGYKNSQMSSCYLLSMEDNLESMYECLKRSALISKTSGGLGVNISMLRPAGSSIFSTGGKSDGIIPFMKVWNEMVQHVNQGGGKRKGSVALYIEPHHPDILKFLKTKRNNTIDSERCLDVHIALWIPDLFMKRLSEKGVWSLFDSNVVKYMHDVYGEDYERRYLEAESAGLYVEQIPIVDLWKEVLKSQMETGEPYISYKDHVNRKSNQSNLGTIRGSNLCNEISEYTDDDTVAVCNLASICLPSFVKNGVFDFEELSYTVGIIVENMNLVIDKNSYPIKEALKSNMETRPTGIGVQGLADVFQMLDLAWHDDEAKLLNRQIFACIYYSAMRKSCDMARERGAYPLFDGSPASRGVLQPDLWGVEKEDINGMLCWDSLRADVMQVGVMNSLLIAQMPTASTAQIMGNNESIEPYTSNIYSRQVLSGSFVVVNPHLYRRLSGMGLWTNEVIDSIIRNQGSVQHISGLDVRTKEIYKTAWELGMKVMVDMSADRGAYICQTQSFNCFMEEPTMASLSSMLMYGWQRGLKTGSYYIRRRSKVQPIQFSLDAVGVEKKKSEKEVVMTCDDTVDGVCMACSA